MRIAIIGTGISGLTAAHLLHPEHEIVVYEAGDHVGGHTNTIRVDTHDATWHVDTGFIVLNDRNYPRFEALLDALGVERQPTKMSFSVSAEAEDFEYSSGGLGGLLAQPSNLGRPRFLRMVADYVRFNRAARRLLLDPDDDRSLRAFLEDEGFWRWFVDRARGAARDRRPLLRRGAHRPLCRSHSRPHPDRRRHPPSHARRRLQPVEHRFRYRVFMAYLDLDALVRLGARNGEALDRPRRWLRPLIGPAHALGRARNTIHRSRRQIAAHYDLGNDLFALFLDERMTYSSAIFPTAGATLEEAALHKLDLVCRKLDLSPADHLLEIGTGWGGLAVHAAAHYGCRVTTTTSAREQHDHAVALVRATGLEDRVTVLLRDYRELDGSYDKLVSIEMIEAVGWKDFGTFFARCSDLLAPHGLMLLIAEPEELEAA